MISFAPSSSFAARTTMGQVRPCDLLHIEDADGSARQLTVTAVAVTGKTVTITAHDLHADIPPVPAITGEDYRAMTDAEKADYRAAAKAASTAARRAFWSSTHRVSTPVAKALGRNVTVAYKKP
jgi:hypothetical protein